MNESEKSSKSDLTNCGDAFLTPPPPAPPLLLSASIAASMCSAWACSGASCNALRKAFCAFSRQTLLLTAELASPGSTPMSKLVGSAAYVAHCSSLSPESWIPKL